MKPVCVHTMGRGYKTVNASPILADPSHVEVILFQRLHFSSIPCVFYLCFPLNCWIRCNILKLKPIQHNVRGPHLKFCSPQTLFTQCKGSYTPGFCTVPALLSLSHFIARPCKSAPVADQRPREQHTESHLIHTGCGIRSIT